MEIEKRMIVADLMTKEVISVKPETPVLEALKILREHDFRRLPVVDEDGHPVGVVSQRSIESIKPQSGLPALWQIGPWAAKHTVDEIMHKKLVTVKPADTVEYATAKAQNSRVGTLLVVDEDGKMAGVVTTNDIFYKVVNPTLGIGEPGTRVMVKGGGTGENTEKVISAVNKLKVPVKVIWSVCQADQKNNLVLHLDTDDARKVISELNFLGYEAKVLNR